MVVQMRFKNIRQTRDLLDYAERKIDSISSKFKLEPLNAEIDLMKIKKLHKIKCKLNGAVNSTMEASSYDVFASVDAIVHKINKLLRRRKSKISKENRQSIRNQNRYIDDSEDSYQEADRSYEYDEVSEGLIKFL